MDSKVSGFQPLCSSTRPHAAINSRMTDRPFGHPAHQSFSFCLRSDFLILPGFIDFIADEVVSTSSFDSRGGGAELFKGRLWERLSLGMCCGYYPYYCGRNWHMGQRVTVDGEEASGLGGDPAES